MTKNKLYHMTWKLRATGALVLALALSTFPVAFSRAVNAQAPTKATAQTPAETAASPAGESKGGQKEGIKVHGHWTIDVRNPDGKLVEHREFENALTSSGKRTLADLLSHVMLLGLWRVFLAGPSEPWTAGSGFIAEPNDSFGAAANFSKVLTVNLVPATPAVVLAGSIAAQQNGTIDTVGTQLSNVEFTAHTLAPLVNGACPANTQCVVNVAAGQIVQVTVAISFS